MGKKKEDRKLKEEKIKIEEKEFNLRFEKYKILIAARNFHYENFNKWMTYFYVAIGALFIGYTSISVSKENIENNTFLLNLLCILGFICSVLWLLSAKGYYYWNINFITLVNHYEKEILKFPQDERVYFVFANKGTENQYFLPHRGANISTSKVAIFFAFLISCFWGILFYKNILIPSSIVFYNIISWFTLSVITILVSMFIGKEFFKSKIDHFHDLRINQ